MFLVPPLTRTVGAPGAFHYARAMIRVGSAALFLAWLCACAGTQDDLERATLHYEEARYETALVWLAELEGDLPQMTPADRSTFLYLRGMSAYRLGQRDDAVHYLSLARESVVLETSSLTPSLKTTLARALVVLESGLAPTTERRVGAR